MEFKQLRVYGYYWLMTCRHTSVFNLFKTKRQEILMYSKNTIGHLLDLQFKNEFICGMRVVIIYRLKV